MILVADAGLALVPEACGGAAVEETGGEEDTEAEAAGGSGLVRSLRPRLEEERGRPGEAGAERARQSAGNAGLGSQLSRLEAQLASKKAFWEVGTPAPCYVAAGKGGRPAVDSGSVQLGQAACRPVCRVATGAALAVMEAVM